MKKTHKKILGLVSLVFVVAMTIVAALLPAPETQAANTSVTDTISVRVVGSVPNVGISGITNDSIFTSPSHSVTVEYENVEYLSVILKYTDADGVVHDIPLLQDGDDFVDYNTGEVTFNFNLLTGEYSYINKDGDEVVASLGVFGYGEYELDVIGQGWEGGTDGEYRTFSFYPVYGEVDREETPKSYQYYLDLHYDTYKEDGTGGEVNSLRVKVYDADKNEVVFSPIIVNAPTDRIELPFADYGLAEGIYTIKIYAYNQFGNLLYAKPYELTVDYVIKRLPTPNTGSFFQDLNISKTDYVVTGLIVFGIVAVAGVMVITKRDKKKSSLKSKRRK